MTLNHRPCKKCLAPFRPADLTRGICEGCMKVDNEQAKRELKQSDNRAVGKAAYEFLSHIQKAKDKATVGPAIFETILEKLGGKEGFADKLIEDFNAVRGEEGIASANVKYWTLFNELRKEYDQNVTVDVSGMTDEDLVAVIQPVAERIIREDKALRTEIIKQLISDDPEFRKEVLELGGSVVMEGMRASTPKIPLNLNYEEAGDDD